MWLAIIVRVNHEILQRNVTLCFYAGGGGIKNILPLNIIVGVRVLCGETVPAGSEFGCGVTEIFTVSYK